MFLGKLNENYHKPISTEYYIFEIVDWCGYIFSSTAQNKGTILD